MPSPGDAALSLALDLSAVPLAVELRRPWLLSSVRRPLPVVLWRCGVPCPWCCVAVVLWRPLLWRPLLLSCVCRPLLLSCVCRPLLWRPLLWRPLLWRPLLWRLAFSLASSNDQMKEQRRNMNTELRSLQPPATANFIRSTNDVFILFTFYVSLEKMMIYEPWICTTNFAFSSVRSHFTIQIIRNVRKVK